MDNQKIAVLALFGISAYFLLSNSARAANIPQAGLWIGSDGYQYDPATLPVSSSEQYDNQHAPAADEIGDYSIYDSQLINFFQPDAQTQTAIDEWNAIYANPEYYQNIVPENYDYSQEEYVMSENVKNGPEYWRAPAVYAGWIADNEQVFDIPSGLLERLLYSECRYREDIINGITRSRTGATGIAQFMPRTAAWLGVDPLDPWQSIAGAAEYLDYLYKKFKSWKYAVMAYNWGEGNVRKYIRGEVTIVPSETSKYISQISTDVAVV